MRLPPNKAISVPSGPFPVHSCTCPRSIVKRTLARRKVAWQFFFSGERKQNKSFFKVPHNKKLKNKVHMRIVSDALPEINNRSVTEMKPSFFLNRRKCVVSRCEEFLTVKRGAPLSPAFWELSLGSQSHMSRRFFRMLPLPSTVLFPRHRTSTKWLTQNDSTPGRSVIYLQGGLLYAHREQECSRNPGALPVCPPSHVTHRHHRVCPTPWENQRPPSIPADAGNRFRFSGTPGHLGWSGLRKPALCCLSEAWISSRAFSWHFSFVRRFFSYSVSSLMAGR